MTMTTGDTAALFIALALGCATMLAAAAESQWALLVCPLAAVGAIVIVFHQGMV